MAQDENSYGGRLRRYAQVGTRMSGLAAKLAGERYLGRKIDRNEHASELKAALGGIKGPLMKVAQILATIPDALPKEYAQELAQLQSNAPSMGWPFVRRRMSTELGPKWQTRFQEFDREACKAASLGQVHKAVDPDGRRLACKLQYPDMASAVEADLKQLNWILSLYRRYDDAINTDLIYDELSARLREELDYDRELRNMLLYRHILKDEEAVFVPEPVAELSSKRLISMTWLEGDPFKSCLDRSQEERNQIALNMFRTWYVPFYFYGVIHGDPHMGNYTVRPDGRINLLDFGSIRVFEPAFVKGVIDLYNALKNDDHDLAVEAYRTWGFTDLRKDLIDVLNIWASFVYGPILDDRVRSIQDDNTGLYGADVARKVHIALKEVGGVTPPREFVLMDRAAVGLGSVFMHLKAEVNWYQVFNDMIGDFDHLAMAKRQSEALGIAGLSPEEIAA
ncbi:MAG: AarF/ABC1/UbiB kinase family protein [Alphaproteobacteria bacterium]|nr:AarF/ABC1/UbiB kinase family protein [Alphaproteobacteria bacterium]